MLAGASHNTAAPGMSAKDWALLLLLGLIWGGSFFFARVAVAEVPPLTLVLLRVAIAAPVLQLYLAARGVSFALALPHAGSPFLLALINNVIPFSLIFAGHTAIGAGLASVLNATTPFWTLILANALTADERLTGKKIAGILLGVAGSAVMIGPGLLAGVGEPVWAKPAYSLAFLLAKRFTAVAPSIVATGQLTAATVMMIPVAFAVHGPTGPFFPQPAGLECGRGTGTAVDGIRLCLRSYRRLRRRHQRLAGHAFGAAERHSAGLRIPWRASGGH
jgi:drug/metabolite transporter (DMT)-like permease